jgi:histone H3/H4
VLGQRWSQMTDEDKRPYQDQAALERDRVSAATEAWKKAAVAAAAKAAGSDDPASQRLLALATTNQDQGNNTEAGSQLLSLPVARIRKICRLDPEVRGLSKEALVLITKATELATIKLGRECIRTAHIQNRRTLLPDDVADVCRWREPFFFLKEDIADLHRQQQKLKSVVASAQSSAATNATSTGGGGKLESNATSSKPLTEYFKPKD